MKLTHEFLVRIEDASSIFPCLSLQDYLSALESKYTNVSYGSYKEYMSDGFSLFAEAYLKYFGKKYNIFNLERKQSKTVEFVGNNSDNLPVSIFPIFLNEHREITMNKDHLSQFSVNSSEQFGVIFPGNMVVVTNGDKVNETIMEEAPSVKDFTYIFLKEIDSNTKDNIKFWVSFAKAISIAIKKAKKEGYSEKYILRDFQLDAVGKMLSKTKGKIILPPGTGKSVIAADYILKAIEKSENPSPVFLVLSPRIILSYQLLNVIFNHLTGNKVNAQYCNLCSGNMDEVAKIMYSKIKAAGLIETPIESSKSVWGIKNHYERAKVNKMPLIVSATYHSGWQMAELGGDIEAVIYDECHNLMMGRFSEDFKEDCLDLKAKNKFFFTATVCKTPSKNGRGMNNKDIFGKTIHYRSFKQMIDKREILPVRLHTVAVDDYLILKNKDEDASEENTKEADFDRDCTVKARAIVEAFHYHEAIIKKFSSNSEKIGAKIIVTINGLPTLQGILASQEISDFIDSGKNVFAISTEIKYRHNKKSTYAFSDFKEKFIKDTNDLDDEDSAIILHIDMLGEGLDNKGITGVMAFSVQGILKTIQLIGRTQRLHSDDRDKLYAGEMPTDVARETVMIKPYGYFIIPVFLRDCNDIKEEASKFLWQIHNSMKFVPSMIYSNSKDPGDNETMTNKDFKSMYEKYEMLDFSHEIEEVQKQKALESIKDKSYNEAKAIAESLGI